MTACQQSLKCPSCSLREAPAGRTVHGCRDLLHRHMHLDGFIAVVLKGSYVEAGDTGRHRVSAGDIIVHRPFERHLDRFSTHGAEVLVLPLPRPWPKSVLARVDDADLISRLAVRDVVAAKEVLVGAMVERPPTVEDWPDLLALDLLADSDLSLSTWAAEHGLHPGSLARGFGQQFDVSPAGFRALVRTRRAIEHIASTRIPLSAIASEHGFSDQAHMSRAVKHVTGHSPFSLRRAFAGSNEGAQRAA